MWFGTGLSAGRITSAGQITIFPAVDHSVHDFTPQSLVWAPDGGLWITGPSGNAVWRMTPAGVATWMQGGGSSPTVIIVGPDGGLWVASNNGDGGISRISLDGNPTCPVYLSAARPHPSALAAGAGGIWFASYDGYVGWSDLCGTATAYTGHGISQPWAITNGPDGAGWFTNYGNNSIGRLTSSGEVTNYTSPLISGPAGITTGPDGALWFANQSNNTIGRITTTGTVTAFSAASINRPTSIALGPDGSLWFTNDGTASIGRLQITPSKPPACPPRSAPSHGTKPPKQTKPPQRPKPTKPTKQPPKQRPTHR